MSELNEDKIKERLEVLENDIKRVSEQMVSLDKQKTRCDCNVERIEWCETTMYVVSKRFK